MNIRDQEMFAGDSFSGQKGKGLYIYIRVDDLEATYAELEAKTIKPYTRPKDWPWGNREFVVKDPDGFKLCFWQPTKD